MKYDWKTLSDDGFENWCNSLSQEELIQTNRVIISYLLRSVEAFQFVSVWRMTDLISSTVNALNNDLLISCAVTGRSAVELTSRYLHSVHVLDKYFSEIPWDKIDTHVLELGYLENFEDPKSNKLIEHEIDRLMWGSRLEEVKEFNPELEQKNILTIIEKIDKTFRNGNEQFEIMPHYKVLSEAAHPNVLGFTRFQHNQSVAIDEKWVSLDMRERADGGDASVLRS